MQRILGKSPNTACLRIKWQRCFTNHHERNQLSDYYHHSWITRSKHRKKMRGEKDVRLSVVGPSHVNKDIRTHINKANEAKHIVSIIRKNVRIIEHPSIFGKAMQKCNNLRDWNSVYEIMKLLESSDLTLDLIAFNIFFNSMAHSDSPQLSIQYFDVMIHKYALLPTVPIFGTMLKSFRRQGKFKEAETFWNLMCDKYKLEPNEVAYTEMISVCAKCHEIEKGQKIFHEYLQKAQQQLLPQNLPTYSAYLNMFSRCGDVAGMTHAGTLIHQAGLKPDEVVVADIMRGLYVVRDFDGCLDMFDNWISHGNRPTIIMMQLKCIALKHKMEISNTTFEDRYVMYMQIKDIIYNQLGKYGLKIDPLIALSELDGAIFLYRFRDPSKIIDVFKDLISKRWISYGVFDKQLQTDIMDLHLFQPWQAQFILRYLIGFECKQLLESLVDDKLWIVVGVGRHAGGSAKSKKGKLKEFVKKELKSWDPPINCCESNSNRGRLYVTKKDLVPYLNGNNFAKQKLTVPSKDWYGDPRVSEKNL
eukprot:954892_1